MCGVIGTRMLLGEACHQPNSVRVMLAYAALGILDCITCAKIPRNFFTLTFVPPFSMRTGLPKIIADEHEHNKN